MVTNKGTRLTRTPISLAVAQSNGTIGIDEKPLKPPLKWAGGKRWLVSHLKPLWQQNEDRKYVEPFCGGLAVALGLQPKCALVNDINPHVISFYRQIQTGLRLEIEMRNNEELFYRHRARFNALIAQGLEETAE